MTGDRVQQCHQGSEPREVNTENKKVWCQQAEPNERAFAVQRLFDLGLAGAINVEKRDNPYTHDLFINWPSDLKTVRTPLFKAQELYGIDPQWAVTFNVKDAHRYREKYPNIVVIFDVKWEVTCKEIGGCMYEVEPMHVTYAGFLDDLRRAVVKAGSQRIAYQRRVNDTAGNAKESFVFDLRDLHFIREVL